MLKSFEEFAELAQKTKSEQFHGNLVAVDTLINILQEVSTSVEPLDKVKKSLFYGKEFSLPNAFGNFDLDELFPTQQDKDLLHGLIGKITECGELADALIKSLDGGEPLDLVNIEEEMGDGFWYDSLIIKSLRIIRSTTFLGILTKCIDKLKARFGDKFSEEKALNRDLETERKILES